MTQGRTGLFRRQGDTQVTPVELFFDLIFVFAITQLSHTLLEHLTPLGILQTGILFVAVWWAWIYTSWVTNWLDPRRLPVRFALFGIMLVGLLLSTSIPQAFGARGITFAAAYVTIQVGRTLFMLWAMGDERPQNTRNFQRILVWLLASGVFWLLGGLAEGNVRLVLWLVALGTELAGPAFGFWVPRLGASTTGIWGDISGEHIAERCMLFVILSLGESILVTGGTFAGLEWTRPTIMAFVLAFIGSLAFWWLYFDANEEVGREAISHSSEPGRLARLAYTYLHLPIIAGIVVSAVGDEQLLAHPTGDITVMTRAIMFSSGALFLLGLTLFQAAVTGRVAFGHIVATALLGLLALFGGSLSPLVFTTGAVVTFVIAAIWEGVVISREGAH